MKSGALALAVLLPTLVNLVIVARGYDGGPYLRGDCPFYYATAVSLLRDKDLDLRNQLTDAALSGNVSLSIDGRVVPKHPILLPIVSAPFIAAWNTRGALVFNLVQFAILLALMYVLAIEAGTAPAFAAAAVLLTYAGSNLPHYAWNYSPDLLAAAVLCGATVTSARADSRATFFAAGLLGGLAVAAKYPLLLCVPGVALVAGRWTIDRAVAFAAGVAVPLGGIAWLNTRLFGAPWTTSYDRILVDDGVRTTIVSQRQDFTGPIWNGMFGQLFDRQHGLVTTSPMTLIALGGFAALAKRRPRLAAHVGAASLALFVFYSAYREWPASHYGNRFLIPVAALCVAPLAALLQAAWRRMGLPTGSGDRARTSPPDPTPA